MRVLKRSPAIREHAKLLAESKLRPRAIRRAQRIAWVLVLRSRNRLQREARAFDQLMAAANKLMRDTPEWERQDRELRERFIRKCERIRQAASKREMDIVKKIRRRLGDKLQEQAVRVPVLRRVMQLPRLNSLTQRGACENELLSHPAQPGSLRTPYGESSIKTRRFAPPTDRPAPA